MICVVTLVENYLKERFCLVKQGNLKSGIESLGTGVPQGSILGPLLFIIFFNDLNFLSVSSKIFQYADDTTITLANNSLDHLINDLTSDLILVSKWLHHNHLLLNINKTQAMDFTLSNRGCKQRPAPKIQLNGTDIDYVYQIKLLGVTFDKHLKFDQHTINICKKVNFKVFILSRCAHLFHSNFKLILFKLCILSHFDYCSTVYLHLTSISKMRLERCFRRALHRLVKINIKGMAIEEQFSTLAPLKLLPLQLRQVYRFTMFLFSLCKRNEKCSIYQYIFKQKNFKDNLILPKCHSDLLKFSFSNISIKFLNLFLRECICLSKETFIFFLNREILDIFEATTDFFS